MHLNRITTKVPLYNKNTVEMKLLLFKSVKNNTKWCYKRKSFIKFSRRWCAMIAFSGEYFL